MKISDSIHRLDARDKISGNAKYIEDFSFENAMYAVTIRATKAHAKIVSVAYPEGFDSVVVVDARDVKVNEVAMIEKDMPVFADLVVKYYGEPIALAISSDRNVLSAFLKQVRIEYEEQEGIYTIDSAIEKKSFFKTHYYEKGSFENLKYTDIYEETYTNGYQDQAYLEKQGLAAYMDGDVLTVIGSMQCPYYIKNALLNSTGLAPDKVRVIQAATGGAFGGKEDYPSLMACQLAAAVKKTNRPVVLIFDRREDLFATTKKHPSKVSIKSYLDGERIVGMEFDTYFDAGAYVGLSDVVLQRGILTLPGSYNFENLKVSGAICKTNNAFTGAFRGFGAPQTLFALEMHMNSLARKLGKDPMEFREEYFLKQFDTSGPGGTIHEKVLLDEMKRKLVENSSYNELVKNKQPWEGIGVSFIPHGGGFTGDGEAAHIKAKVQLERMADDSVKILVASVDMGQGTKTALVKIVAKALDLPIDRVHFEIQDTSLVPDSGPTAASRTVMVVGGLLYKAAMKLKETTGPIVVEENYKLPDYVKWDQNKLQGNAYMAYSWSAVLARVKVDPATYETSVTELFGVYDLGVPIDENMARGQIAGGMIQGVGGVLTETMESKEGKITHDSFSSYTIPTTLDIPNMHIDWVDNHFDDGPFGAKPIGELTVVGVYPAIASAIADAIGKDIFSLPVTPEKICEVLEDGK